MDVGPLMIKRTLRDGWSSPSRGSQEGGESSSCFSCGDPSPQRSQSGHAGERERARKGHPRLKAGVVVVGGRGDEGDEGETRGGDTG